jgi:endoglycosylceramidase
VQRTDFERARTDAATFGGAPVFVGEWGSGPERAADPNDVYFRIHQQYQDEFRFSATLWTWRESCGDPHKAGDARAGRIPAVWGEFEVDCRTNTVTGTRDALLAELNRAYVRAAPGHIVESTYGPATGAFTASGRDAREGTQVEAWYPKRLRTGAISSTGLEHLQVRSPRRGRTLITATTTAAAWRLAVTP